MKIENQNPTVQENPTRQARAQRILDAAGSLILRWGYNKTTIEDVAQLAGVAKGTIYLHWKTREDLFMALMQRERLALTEAVKARLAADQAGATLHGMFKHSALALLQRPLLKAALLRDMEVLGKLMHSEQTDALFAERVAGFTAYLEVLRAHDLVRTDLSLRAQVYMVSAIFMGFLQLSPLMPEGWAVSDAELADLLAETIQRTLGRQPALTDAEQPVPALALTEYLQRETENAYKQLG